MSTTRYRAPPPDLEADRGATLAYGFRPRPFSRPVDLVLDDAAITVTLGTKERRIPFSDLSGLRLQYRPRNTQNEGYVCKVHQKGAPTLTIPNLTWISLVEVQRQDAAYRRFVTALVRRARRHQPALALRAGLPGPVFALATLAGPAAVLGMAWVGLMALMDRNWPIALLVGGLAAYFGHWTWRYLQRNRPRTFAEDEIPDSVLPRIPRPTEG